MLRAGLRLGTPFGIETRVHWTFGLLVGWAAWSEFQRGGGWTGAGFAVGLLCALFACVTLHELGHCLMARRFGIGTSSITLYPIGGVARLDAMPREPFQEMAIALAGPAVNVALAGALFPVIWSQGWLADEKLVLDPSWRTLALSLFALNAVMAAFNLLPAFPMDGGRVLRAVLALGIGYRAATNVAARLGQVVALGFVAVGLGWLARWWPWLSGSPVLAVIGGFIFLSAGRERRMVEDWAAWERARSWFSPVPPPLPVVVIRDAPEGPGGHTRT
jgi:Zn-dependent protease